LNKKLDAKQSKSKAQKTVTTTTTTTKPQKQSMDNNKHKAKQSKLSLPLSLSLSLSLSCLFLVCLIVSTLPLSWWIPLHPLSPTKLLQGPEQTIANSWTQIWTQIFFRAAVKKKVGKLCLCVGMMMLLLKGLLLPLC
jgi:hypothetical protein